MIPESWVVGCEDYVIDTAFVEAVRKMRAGMPPKLAPLIPDLYYPNGCPVLNEGPQKDDL